MWLFAPKEVKSTLLAFELVKSKYPSVSFGFAIIEEDVKSYINMKESTVSSIKNEGISPEELAYVWIRMVTEEFLCSGRYHTYRGVLSTQGNELLNLYDYSTDALRKMGNYGKKKAKEAKAWIRNQVEKVG